MHKNFGEWYRLISIEPKDEILKKRWQGVEEWVSTIRGDDADLLETVRIFRGLPEKTSREEFQGVFRKHDAAFGQRDNELEQRLLAGAALVHCVFTHGDEGDDDGLRAAVLAGTSLEASRLLGVDKPLEELTGEVLSGLHEIGRQERRRTGFSNILLEFNEEEALKKTLEQLATAPDHNQLRTQVGAALQAFLKAVNRSESALEQASHDLRCADEETNILWWIAGGNSRTINKPWGALKDAVPLVAGWELAELTDVALGPQDAAALLDSLIPETKVKRKGQAFQVYINAVPEEWAKERAMKLDERALDLAPFSLALSQRCKSDTTSWQTFFESVSGLKASVILAPERVARLAYTEAVLFRTLVSVES